MKSINVTNAKEILHDLIEETNIDNKPIQIVGKSGNAILISENDWKLIQESLDLKSNKGRKDTNNEGKNTPDDKYVEELYY